MKWFVKKEIEAPTITQAIKSESKFPVIDAWKAEEQKDNINTYAIGFNVDVSDRNDDEVSKTRAAKRQRKTNQNTV